VWVAARSASEVQAVAAEICQTGGQAHPLTLDVTDSAQVSQAIDRLGELDILVNSAGTNRPALITQTNDSDLDEVMTLNVKAAAVAPSSPSRHRWAMWVAPSARCTAPPSMRSRA
jgi:NADP-dependent 3-hydroxy acid dehydrogenase YdfG